MVDLKGLQGGVVGFAALIIAVTLGVIILDSISQSSIIPPDGTNTTFNGSRVAVDASIPMLGGIITTWGTILVLGLVVVFIFVGMLLALNLLSGSNKKTR